MNLKFHARRGHFFGNEVEIIAGIFSGGAATVVQSITLVRTAGEDALAVEPQPFVTLSRESAQNLIDELWNVGLRPSEGTGSAGSLAATERHLADMRALVTKAYDAGLK